MSRSTLSKTSAILVGLSLLTLTSLPALAKDEVISSAVRPEVKQNATAVGALKNRPVANRVIVEKNQLENRLENIQERLASRAAALKSKLEAFKDKKKAAIAERVNTNLNRLNQNQTQQMQMHLGTMSNILDKLEARVNKGTPDIKDPAAAKAAIASARTAIASSSAIVSAQAEKDYTITVTTETKIKADIKNMRDKLHTDLQTTRATVISAKQAVADAIRTAKSGAMPKPEKKELEKEGTSSGSR